MTNRLSRSLLVVAAVVLAAGAVVHAAEFNKAAAVATASNLPAFYANVLKAFWLMDAATLILVAAIFGRVAAKPDVATRSVIALVALVPASTAILLYTFLGPFLPAHLLIAAAVMAAAAAMLGVGDREHW